MRKRVEPLPPARTTELMFGRARPLRGKAGMGGGGLLGFLKSARTVWLFLDYDGTLREIADRPQQAAPGRRLLALLRRIQNSPRLSCAIITGRPVESIRRMLPLEKIWFVGTHGLEICRGNGRPKTLVPVKRAGAAIQKICAKLLNHINSDFTLENKGASLSLHFRLADEKNIGHAKKILHKLVSPYTKSAVLEKHVGKGVVEVCPKGVHKGLGIDFLLKNTRPADAAVAIGDDRTDENMFRAVRNRGVSIVVGKRKSAADLRFKNPAQVRNFLRKLCDQEGGGGRGSGSRS